MALPVNCPNTDQLERRALVPTLMNEEKKTTMDTQTENGLELICTECNFKATNY